MNWLNDATVTTAEEKQAEAKEQVRQAAKAERDAALGAIVHDFGDGRVMQVRPKDMENIKLAIEISAQTGMSHQWLMADNSVADVTGTELEQARISGITQGQAIWSAYTKKVAEL